MPAHAGPVFAWTGPAWALSNRCVSLGSSSYRPVRTTGPRQASGS